ncbi:MAG: hypothetical protein CENE_02538 [Candidatus Celerinatantimonas neptuna]|nr:MAG: hypothetical protein CENE_02538 [Candidatus Celerinatantimonas neptuna]
MIDNIDYTISEKDNVFCSKLPNIVTIHEKVNQYVSMGRGGDNDTRIITAFAEIIERYSLWSQQADLISSYFPHNQKHEMLSPLKQLLPLGSLLDNRVVEWKKYQSEVDGHEIYIHRPVNVRNYASYFVHTSNGSAVHETKREAIKSAKDELLERHLYNIFWLFEKNLFTYDFSCEVIKYTTELGWKIDFFTITDYVSCTLCVMTNIRDSRFASEGIVIGLSYGKREEPCLRAYTECLQTLEAYLAFDKNINCSSLFYLSGAGTDELQAKINCALSSNPISITEDILKNNDVYYFTEGTLHDLVYCEVVIPMTIPLQTDAINHLRLDQEFLGFVKSIPKYNPLG